MELKYTNLNGEIVLKSKLSHVELFFLKNYENWVQKQIKHIIFSRSCYNCPQNKMFQTFFTSLIQMKWIKDFHVDKNIIYEEKKYSNSNFFLIYFVVWSPLFWAYLAKLLLPSTNWNSNNISKKRMYFSFSKKSFKKSWQQSRLY